MHMSSSAAARAASRERGVHLQEPQSRKCHALVDVDSRAIVLAAHPASIQDRDGIGPLLKASRRPLPFLAMVFADTGSHGPCVSAAAAIAVEIVRAKPDKVGFAMQPRQRVVERVSACISRNRRL
jgi:putative transposase